MWITLRPLISLFRVLILSEEKIHTKIIVKLVHRLCSVRLGTHDLGYSVSYKSIGHGIGHCLIRRIISNICCFERCTGHLHMVLNHPKETLNLSGPCFFAMEMSKANSIKNTTHLQSPLYILLNIILRIKMHEL